MENLLFKLIGETMDNERHALEMAPKKCCEKCKWWVQFNHVKGFCDKVGTPYDETMYDFECCETWEWNGE